MLLWEVFLITNGLGLRETKLCYGLFVTVFICILFFSRNPEQWRITFSAKKSSKPLPSCSYHSQMRSRNYIIIRQRITYPRYLRSNRPLATRYAITEINKNKKRGRKMRKICLIYSIYLWPWGGTRRGVKRAEGDKSGVSICGYSLEVLWRHEDTYRAGILRGGVWLGER